MSASQEDHPNEFVNTSSTYRSQSWHPKLTPYRTLVLSSTIGLGSAKAYASSQDAALAATTIEWIAGVALFSIFFILGLLESNPPRYLSYLFDRDLMSLICFPFRPMFGCHYFTENENAVSRQDMTSITHTRILHPPLTGYRLLTSLSVTSFGLTKACLAYQGFSVAANSVDWIVGVLLTSCLYVLGLYEDNPGGLMPYLFLFDYTPLLLTGSLLILHLFGLLLCCIWISYWVFTTVTLPERHMSL